MKLKTKKTLAEKAAWHVLGSGLLAITLVMTAAITKSVKPLKHIK